MNAGFGAFGGEVSYEHAIARMQALQAEAAHDHLAQCIDRKGRSGRRSVFGPRVPGRIRQRAE